MSEDGARRGGEPPDQEPPPPDPQDAAPKRVPEVTAPVVKDAQVLAQFRFVTEELQGPLPPPEDLSRYNQLIPDGAERIMRMAEEGHRSTLALSEFALRASIEGAREERALAKEQLSLVREYNQGIGQATQRAQYMSLAIVLGAYGVAITALLCSQPWVAGVAAVLTPVIQAFLRSGLLSRPEKPADTEAGSSAEKPPSES